jgi:hypothetical protein
MLVWMRLLRARVLPHGWVDALRQFLLFAGTFEGYRLVRGLVEGRATAAFQNAREVIAIERTLHVFVEPSIQAWVSGSQLIMTVASWIYVNAQTSVTFGALVFLYVFHNRNFYFVRNMLIIGMGLALISYLVFPTAPPRFFPEWGFIDTVSDFTGVNVSQASATANALFNPYAAVPSMHVAFALMIGWPLARLSHWRAVRIVWRLYPLLIAFVIVVTANHFIADAVLGAVTAAISAYGARRLSRHNPAWSFSPDDGLPVRDQGGLRRELPLGVAG